MPELPEVETVRRGLVPVMEGRTIARADVRRADLRWPFPPRMADRLSGKTVQALRRRSKYLLAELDSGETLLWHLGMSGRVLIDGPGSDQAETAVHHHAIPQLSAHDHVVFDMEDGSRITFNDPRRFGAMDLSETANLDAHPLLARLGPEPLGNGFHATYLFNRLRGSAQRNQICPA